MGVGDNASHYIYEYLQMNLFEIIVNYDWNYIIDEMAGGSFGSDRDTK